MHEPVETIESEEHEGWKVEIFQDWDAQSPASWDTLGELVAFDRLWRDYRFASRVSNSTEDEAVNRGGAALLKRWLLFCENEIAVTFRFDEYGSGQARIYSSDYEGSNPSGFIVTNHKRVSELCGDDPTYHTVEWIEQALEEELGEWDKYVQGDVYGYVVEGPDGDHYDSCWGFYGFEYACQEARQQLEWAIQHEKEELKKIERSVAI